MRAFTRLVVARDGISGFADGFEGFRMVVSGLQNRSRAWQEVWKAWDEFSETIVLDDVAGPLRLRNSIRPASFLNVEDLGFGPGSFRILPTVFVSLGLLLTFLGLVAALSDFAASMQASGPGTEMEAAMTAFMQIASAKFVMSLVGLMCSILFGLLLRTQMDRLEGDLHNLCAALERRLVFVSLEDIGLRQLRAANEQREHLKEIGFSMVAELRKPLDALPEQISKSISAQMEPIFQKVGSLGTSSMENLVGDLSSQLSHSVGNALNRASESLGEASDRIGQMIDRMNASNSQAGEGLQAALGQLSASLGDLRAEVAATGTAASSAMTQGADQLLAVMNDTLSGIRDNTSEGARAMQAAAEAMREAAESFRDQISSAAADGANAVRAQMQATSSEAGHAVTGAGTQLLATFAATSQQIADLGKDMSETVGQEILSRLGALADQLDDMVAAIESGAREARSAATGLAGGAQSIAGASTSFDAASRNLLAAADPIQAAHVRIEESIRRLGNSVETVSDTLMRDSRQLAENATTILSTASQALGTEREGIRQSLEASRAALRLIAEQARKLDGIDEMLGRALSAYSSQLEAALGTAQDHVIRMRDTLAPGLDTLRSVVEQAEAFAPTQRRTS